jgi:hypothetical protein
MFDAGFPKLRVALSQLDEDLSAYHAANAALSVPYPRDAIERIPVEALDTAWRQATTTFWPLNLLKQGQVKKQLQTYTGGAKPDPATDLAELRRMQTPEGHR